MTFEKALSAGFIQATDYVEIWQAYLDYLRRRVDFKQGIKVPVFPIGTELFLRLSFGGMRQWPRYLTTGQVVQSGHWWTL